MGYKIEEKECHISYDLFANKTYVYTNIPKCMTKFKKAGWEVVNEEVENGKVIAMLFELDDFPITPRKRKTVQ